MMDQERTPLLKGTCLTMCPHAEVQLRLKSGLGHKLEKRVISGVRSEFADPKLMIKEFSRSSAGHKIKPSDVRPIPVLVKTIKYLFAQVCSFEDVSWQEIYSFVSNRIRAVHQDVVVQGNDGEEVICIFSSAARFYVYSHYRLCESECDAFNSHLNLQQLREVLLSVLPMIRVRLLASYTQMEALAHQVNNLSIEKSCCSLQNDHFKSDLNTITLTHKSQVTKLKSRLLEEVKSDVESYSVEDDDDDDAKKNHDFVMFSLFEEIIALHILMNIGKAEVIFEILELPKGIRTGVLKNVIKASISYFCGNHLPLVRLSSCLPPILAVALALQLKDIQRITLGSWSVAYSSVNLSFKIEDLKELLLFPSEKSLLLACHHYGISVCETGVKFIKSNFNWNASVLPTEKAKWVEEKLNLFPLSQMLLGTIP